MKQTNIAVSKLRPFENNPYQVRDDAEMNTLIEEANMELDAAERTKKVENIVATVNQDAPQISLYQSVWLRAHDAKLQGVVCSATGYIDWNMVYWAE